MSKFTRYRKKQRIELQKKREKLISSIESLESFNKKVQKLYADHPDFKLEPNKPENLALWKKYTQDYYDTLTTEFE